MNPRIPPADARPHRIRRWFARGALLVALATAGAPSALADARKPIGECLVAHARVRLGDVYPAAPKELESIDLGPAPLPGSSRLVTRAEIVAAMPADAALPADVTSVRVVRKTSTLSAASVEKLATDALAKTTIPKGGQLVAVRPGASIVVPDGWDVVDAKLSRLPRKAGKLKATVTLRFREGATSVMSTDVPVELLMPESAATPDVSRGAKASFIVRRGSVEVRAVATVGADADVGDEVSVTITESGRVLRGRLVESQPPLLEEVP